MRIPDIRPAQGQMGVSNIVQEDNVLSGIGAGLETLGKFKIQKEERDADAWFAKASTDAELAATQTLENARLSGNPEQIAANFFKGLEDSKNTLLEDAPNDFAKEKFNSFYENLRSNYGQEAIETQINEVKQVRKNGLQQSIDSLIANQASVGYENTKAAIDRAISSGVGSIYGGADAEVLKTKYAKQIAKNDVELTAQNSDYETTLQALEAHKDVLGEDYNTYKEKLTGINGLASEMGAVAASIKSGVPLAGLTKKGANVAVKGYTDLVIKPMLSEKNPEGINQVVGLVNVAGKVPTEIKDYVAKGMAADDIQQRTYTYNLVNSINSGTFDNYLFSKTFNKKTITEAEHFKKLVDSGMPEQDVFAVLDRTYRNVDDKITKKVRDAANDFAENESLPSPRSIDAGLTISSPLYPEQLTDMEGDELKLPEASLAQEPLVEQTYKNLLKEYYTLSQDEELARTQALKALRQQVGMSKATGKSMMMFYPPERYYSIPSDPSGSWIKESIQLDIATHYPDYSERDIMLVPDDITKSEIDAGIRPTYRVFGVKNNMFNDLGRIDFEPEKWEERLSNQKKESAINEIEADKQLNVRYYFQQMSGALKDANNNR